MQKEIRAFEVKVGDIIKRGDRLIVVDFITPMGGGGDEDDPALLGFNDDQNHFVGYPYAALVPVLTVLERLDYWGDMVRDSKSPKQLERARVQFNLLVDSLSQ